MKPAHSGDCVGERAYGSMLSPTLRTSGESANEGWVRLSEVVPASATGEGWMLIDGTLLGRRILIEDSAQSYQKCDLGALRSYATGAVLEDLASAGNMSAAMLRRGAVYGELCSMLGKYEYDYVAAGFAKQWLAFGALLEFPDGRAAQAYAQAATEAGFLCRADGAIVHVMNGGAFGAILQRAGVPAVADSEKDLEAEIADVLGEDDGISAELEGADGLGLAGDDLDDEFDKLLADD